MDPIIKEAEAAAAVAAVADIKALLDEWESFGGPGTIVNHVFGTQMLSVEFAVGRIREILHKHSIEAGNQIVHAAVDDYFDEQASGL